MKKIIFFLRHNNDIDHITPVINKWLTTKDIATDIDITTDKKLFNDYRIKHLREISKKRDDVDFNVFNFWMKRKSFYEVLFDKYFSELTGAVVCFDWNSDKFTQDVCAIAKRHFCTTVALPHGDEPYWNIIQRKEDINYYDAIKIYREQSFFDYIVVPNKLCARRYAFMEDERIKALGSPRYCKEWTKIHDVIKPKLPIHYYDSRMKVVLFLRNLHWNINWREVIVAIQLITQWQEEVYLVVRNHTRGKMTYNLLDKHPWLKLVKNLRIDSKSNSSTLIDWADLVLDLGTSVAWECAQKQKLILMLDYLHANQTTYGKYFPSTIVKSRDNLLDNLRKFSKNKERKLHTDKQQKKFIKEILMDDGKVLERYVNFLDGLLND